MQRLVARKRFGQNFLIDRQFIDRIVGTFEPAADDTVVEIGPGEGAMTGELLNRLQHLTAIEIDRDAVALLRNKYRRRPELRIVEGDVLGLELGQLFPGERAIRIIGNLPYNISSAMLFHLIDQIDVIRDLFFMLQKEVVERLCAAPGSKRYGRLSVMCQYHLQAESLFDVPPEAFRPRPKVMSSVVRLQPVRTKPVPLLEPPVFADVVRAAFAQRRKTIANSLRALCDKQRLIESGLDPQARAETVSVDEYARLANDLAGQHKV